MKALVLFSGGIDSTTCLAIAADKYGKDEVMTLSMSYGQKHSRELEAAEAVIKYYGVNHKKLDLSRIFEGSDCSLLKCSDEEIVSTYVPFRNGLFIAAAASVALSNDCSEIWYGAHSDDAAGNAYPDCSEEFNEHMRQAVFIGSGGKLSVVAPFIGINKASVVAAGLKLNVPYELTWSCYSGGDRPCGLCGTCRDRAAAFRANGIEDPALKGE